MTTKKTDKSEDLKKAHEALAPGKGGDRGKVVTIVLTDDDHLDNSPSQLRKQPEGDDE